MSQEESITQQDTAGETSAVATATEEPAAQAATACEAAEVAAEPEKVLNYVAVIPAEDIKPGGSRSVMIGRREIAIFRVGDDFHAIDNSCTHYGAALCTGWVKDNVVTCPWHCWQFDITNGKCLTVPSRGLNSYPIRIEEGTIQIGIES